MAEEGIRGQWLMRSHGAVRDLVGHDIEAATIALYIVGLCQGSSSIHGPWQDGRECFLFSAAKDTYLLGTLVALINARPWAVIRVKEPPNLNVNGYSSLGFLLDPTPSVPEIAVTNIFN